MKNTLYDAVAFIGHHQFFYIVGHKEPDGDCIGSQLAFAAMLRRRGKTAVALQDGPFDRPETGSFAEAFTFEAPTSGSARQAAIIILDCSTPDRVSERYRPLLSLPRLVIDHHAAGVSFGGAEYIDSLAASTTSLIVDIYEALEEAPTAKEAGLLFFGLATDTGFFRHCNGNSAHVFTTARFLSEHGASVKETYSMIYGNREFAQRRLLGMLLSRAESLFDGKLVITSQNMAERTEAGPNARSSDELYSLLQTVKGVEVIIFLREEAPGLTSVGLRSTNSIDVAAIAREHGGGGHMLASGFNFSGTIEAARELMIGKFQVLFGTNIV